MRKMLTVWLTNKCNYFCEYCAHAKWLHEIDFVDRDEHLRVSNKNLLPWLEKRIDPREWTLHLTGGEPSLYPEIDGLMSWLGERGYEGVVETNGSNPIPKTKGFVRAAAWHMGKPVPRWRDAIKIIKNGKDNWAEKASWCGEVGVPFFLTELNRDYLNGKGEYAKNAGLPKVKGFSHLSYCNAFGDLTACYNSPVDKGVSIHNMSEPPLIELAGVCADCVNPVSVEHVLGMRLG